jgi:hypothetical protein
MAASGGQPCTGCVAANDRSPPKARAFWQVYRNGLLHQGTFSQRIPVYYGLASHDITEIIVIDEATGNFCVHPVRFAKQVLEQIGNDFSTYEGAASAAPPLPTVAPFQIAPDTAIIVATATTTKIVGTAATGQASGDWGGSPLEPPGRFTVGLR